MNLMSGSRRARRTALLSRIRQSFVGRYQTRRSLLAKADRVRQNRVVPTPVAGAKLSVANSIQPDRSALKPAATEARRIRLRGEHGISRKAIAQGMPECSDCTCMLVCVFLSALCTRDRGCSVHPAFPAPSFGGRTFMQTSGAPCREKGEVTSDVVVIASEAKQSIPPLADRWIASLRSQ